MTPLTNANHNNANHNNADNNNKRWQLTTMTPTTTPPPPAPPCADALDRNPLAPFRMPLVDRWKDMGTIVMGKSESGFVRVGDALTLMPNRLRVKVDGVWRDEVEVKAALNGENLRLRITGCEDTDVSPGFVLCSPRSLVPVVTQFEAQIMVVELLEHNPIFTVGYKAVLHIHTVVEVRKDDRQTDRQLIDNHLPEYKRTTHAHTHGDHNKRQEEPLACFSAFLHPRLSTGSFAIDCLCRLLLLLLLLLSLSVLMTSPARAARPLFSFAP